MNYSKVMSSREQTATQANMRAGRELGSPNQTVTRSGDMGPGTGPEGKQDPLRTQYTKTLFAKSGHLLVYYIIRVISKIYFM